MLKTSAVSFVQLGESVQLAKDLVHLRAAQNGLLGAADQSNLIFHLRAMSQYCDNLDLPVAKSLVNARVNPQGITAMVPPAVSREEFGMIFEALKTEMASKLFLFVPSHQAAYYERDDLVSDQAREAFPSASGELRLAGNAFSADLHTAAVLHAMRAAEVGVRALGASLKVELKEPIDKADWQVILNALNPRIREIEQKPRSAERNDDLEFYGQAMTQLGHFKAGWRVRAAHAGEQFTESQAKEAIDRVCSFFEILSSRVSES